MNRLAATALCDVRLQLRNGFYYAAAVVAACMIILLLWLPDETALLLLPVFILQNVLVNTYYFVGGLVLLERGERTFEAQTVTPLRYGEYLSAKLITLGALSLVENLLIAAAALGLDPGLAPIAVGIAISSVLLCLFGVVLVVRYDSINEYLMPSVLYCTLLVLPVVGYFGVGAPLLYEAHPIQGPLTLLRAGFEPVSAGHMAWSVLYPLLWVGPVYLWSRRALRRRAIA
ncbi:MAG: fluoroquinolone export ABC transporter permease subunit [Planctomycetota bacterium]|jgi:fluoroquinolone transport system permease protein